MKRVQDFIRRTLKYRAEKNTKRRWNNGWKKPKLLKAGKIYTNAAKLYCQDVNSGKLNFLIPQSHEF
jgi:hypothetical protein